MKMTTRELIVKIDTNVSNLIKRFDNMEDDFTGKLKSLQQFREETEIYHAEINFKELKPLINFGQRFRNNYKLILGFLIIIVGITGSIISDIITQLFIHK